MPHLAPVNKICFQFFCGVLMKKGGIDTTKDYGGMGRESLYNFYDLLNTGIPVTHDGSEKNEVTGQIILKLLDEIFDTDSVSCEISWNSFQYLRLLDNLSWKIPGSIFIALPSSIDISAINKFLVDIETTHVLSNLE
jgi:hypothetical protein